MAEIKEGLYYTKDHEWVKVEDATATVGIDDYAQQQLTDIVFVELPEKGRQVKQFESVAAVESVKSVSDVFAPLSGKITATNAALADAPQKVNEDPYGEGWFFKLAIDPDTAKKELENLMDAAAYKAYLAQDKKT